MEADERDAILYSDLPVWIKSAKLKMSQQAVLGALIVETGMPAPNATVGVASSGEQKARGVPILGYGGGAILGTRPDQFEPRPIDKTLRRRAA